MKLEELKALIDEHTNEGELNQDELNKAINAKFDGLIDAKVNKAKTVAKDENIAEFIKDKGFENIDQFNAFVKNTNAASSELSEKVTRYEQELSALKESNSALKAENENFTYLGKLNDIDPKYQKFVMSEIKGLVNDETDFDTAKTNYLADNAHYLRDNTQIITKVPKDNKNMTKTDGVTAILERKHGIKLE